MESAGAWYLVADGCQLTPQHIEGAASVQPKVEMQGRGSGFAAEGFDVFSLQMSLGPGLVGFGSRIVTVWIFSRQRGLQNV